MHDEEISQLRRTIALLERENAALRVLAKERGILLESIFESRSWKALQAYRAIRAWLIRQPIHQLARHILRGRFRTVARSVLRGRGSPLVDLTYLEKRRWLQERLHGAAIKFPEQLQSQLAALQKIGLPKGIVIYPPTIEWAHSLFQRPQQLMRGFARQGYWAFFCSSNPTVDKVVRLKEVGPNLFVAESLAMLRFLDSPSTVLWITYPQHIVATEVFHQSRVIYDVIDELEVFATYGCAMEEDHAALLKAAHLVVVTADRLLERVREARPDAILAPNGVWVEDFAPGFPAARPPEDMKRVLDRGAPIVGYHGAIADWFHYELLNEVVAQCPDLSFVLVGPDYDGTLKRLQRRDNVWWLGSKPYQDVPSYVHRFDVAMIPFQVNNITKSTSPIKLFEYMAAEKPIVTTDMPECRKYRSVLIAEDPASFKDCLARALDLRGDPAFIATARREAEENSWGNRVDAVVAALGSGAR